MARIVRTKNGPLSDVSKSQPQKKDSTTKTRHPKVLWVGCRVKMKDHVCQVRNEEERRLIGADSYKRDVYGVIAASNPTSPYCWTVDFGADIGQLDCDDKTLSKDPPTQKSQGFPKQQQHKTASLV